MYIMYLYRNIYYTKYYGEGVGGWPLGEKNEDLGRKNENWERKTEKIT